MNLLISILTGIGTVVLSVFRWVGGMRKVLEVRLDKIETTIAVLEAQELNKVERLDQIDESYREMNRKLDQVLMKLMDQ